MTPNPKSVTTDASQRAVIAAAINRGWVIRKEKGHPWIEHSGHKVTFSQTPSDHRSVPNFKAQIKRCEEGRCQCRGGRPIVITPTDPAKAVSERSVSAMSVDDAAVFFEVGKSRVLQWVKRGDLTPVSPPVRGRTTYITLESIERYDAARKAAKPGHRPAPEPAIEDLPAVTVLPPSEPMPKIKPLPPEIGQSRSRDITLLIAKLEGYALGIKDPDLSMLIAHLKEAME